MERKKNEKPEKQIYSIGYVAGLIGKCDRTIYRAVKDGKIKAIRFGSTSLGIPADEVKRICERGF